MILTWLWLIPVLPFAGAVCNGLLGRRLPRGAVSAIALAASGGAFVLALLSALALCHPDSYAGIAGLLVDAAHHRVTLETASFLPVANLHWGFTLDPLSAVMTLFVSFIGFLIHLYSVGYMAHENGYGRFFAYLNLFMGSMLILILGSSLPVMFVGWEGVGACSYLLIGFYFDRPFDAETGLSCADAGRKAFLTNRVGDFFLVSGMLIAFAKFGALSFAGLESAIGHGNPANSALLTAIGLLLFAGATAKSAQIPLFVWLPDAMAGPTPVSALIHAATLVTAGIYLVCRMWFLFGQTPVTLAVIAVIAVLTALMAAIMGMAATDIKKVLAYSTVSQLGYMFLGLGVGAPASGLFHVFTHAFFKALLFLSAGSVIHALSGEQDIRRMGRLWKVIPITAWSFLIGVLAISGVPGFAGFFSKDAILHHAFTTEVFAQAGAGWLRFPVYGAALLTAGLTAFYMFRLFFLVFFNSDRAAPLAREQAHESPWTMTLPLTLLALGAVVAGWLAPGFGARDWWGDFLAPVLGGHGAEAAGSAGASAAMMANEWILAAFSVAVAGIGFVFAWRFYRHENGRAAAFANAQPGACTLARGKFFVDEIYEAFILAPVRKLAAMVEGFDRWIVDGAVNIIAFAQEAFGLFLRFLQTGVVRDYGVIFALSAAILLLWATL